MIASREQLPVALPAAASPDGEVAIEAGAPRLWFSRAAWFALAIGLVVTAALALTSLAVYNRNERRLLNLRVRELGLVLGAAAPSIQTPLTSAADLAGATAGNPRKFRAFIKPLVGPGRQFTSASLWRIDTAKPIPGTLVGAKPALASLPATAHRLFAHAKASGALNLTGVLGTSHPTLGYEVTVPGLGGRVAVYAENVLPANRRSRLERNSAFADLNYALYLGHARGNASLLVTSVKSLPITGRQASDSVPFGAAALTLVVSPIGSLGGSFFQDLPWIIAILGVLISLAAALMTDRLARRRQSAEQLAGVLDQVAAENRRMYTEQRSISQTLQHALLPDALPQFDGLRVDALYVPAASGVDIGGDWYDVVPAGDGKVLMVIGDVSGHGLRAATTMALVRHATLAYVAQDSRPGAVLARLSEFVNRSKHDYFATVLCALIDVEGHSVTLASAGHMAPLVLDGDSGEFVRLDVDAPIGVPWSGGYRETTMPMPPRATLIAFTDGLVERRGEPLDVGLARLRDQASKQPLELDQLLAKLAHNLASGDLHDDTAMVGIRWRS